MQSDGEEEDCLIETPRLTLRLPCDADAEAIAGLADNWAVASNLARLPHPYRIADAQDWIAAVRAKRGEAAFLVTDRASGAVMGGCGTGPAAWTDGLQLGYWLGEPYWGRGYATEAARAVVGFAFRDPALGHLWCSCRVTNDASRRVIHKCGFQFHGADMMRSRAVGVAVPVEHYCLERGVWQALAGWRGGPAGAQPGTRNCA